MHAMVVHENAGMRAEVVRILCKAGVGAASVVSFEAFDPATQWLQASSCSSNGESRPLLAVVGAAAPSCLGGRPDIEGHLAAREFVAALATTGPPARLLIASAEESDHLLLRQLEALPWARLVLIRPELGWKRAIVDTARAALGMDDLSSDPRRTTRVLDIEVFHGAQGRWTLEFRGRTEEKLHGTLELDLEELYSLVDDSRGLSQLGPQDDWAIEFNKVGRRVAKLLFEAGDGRLRKAFEDVTCSDDMRPQLRLVFRLEERTHGLPIETLKRVPPGARNDPRWISNPLAAPTGQAEWHALNSPILRRYPMSGGRAQQTRLNTPLFWDTVTRRHPANCLVVAADPRPGNIDDEIDLGDQRFLELAALPQVEDEVTDIARILEQRAVAGAVGRVEVLKLSTCDDPMRAFFDALERGPWHMVHFAGHAIEPAARGRAPQLILSPEPGGACGFDAVARVLDDTRFLFVSSCRSASPEFLRLALQERLPAVLGYRWPMPDDKARAFACHFYEALFGDGPGLRSLARALLHARREVFRADPRSPVWAFPQLLTQDVDAIDQRSPPDARSART